MGRDETNENLLILGSQIAGERQQIADKKIQERQVTGGRKPRKVFMKMALSYWLETGQLRGH